MDFLFESKRIFRDIFFNIITLIANVFIRRDRRIIIFGGRYGNRFTGNCRFLFQYCHNNKEKLHFKKVIWATRSESIRKELSKMGYDVVMVRSPEGVYWHLKAGIHVISGASTPSKANDQIKQPDIATVLSLGAVNYNLMHCAFMPKASPRGRDSNVTTGLQDFLVGIFNSLYKIKFLRKYVFYPGGWGNCIWSVPKDDFAKNYLPNDITVITGMPELCPCLKYTSYEKFVINKLKSSGKTIILFTPTWRYEKKNPYRSPLSYERFREFLKNNNYYWVEKLHPIASRNMESDCYDPEVSMLLRNNVDLNVICPLSNLMITDYSSTYQKAIWFYIPFSFYSPDRTYYMTHDFGLNDTFLDFVKDGFCDDVDSLMVDIKEKLKVGYVDNMKEKYDAWREMYFDVEETDYEIICSKLFCREFTGLNR